MSTRKTKVESTGPTQSPDPKRLISDDPTGSPARHQQQVQVCTTDEQRHARPSVLYTNDIGNAVKHGIMGFGDALTSPADTPPR